MTIGERLLKLRKDKNISQEELANVLDVSRQTISKWETGESMPDFNKIVPLCEYFEISSDELLTGIKKGDNLLDNQKENKKNKFARNIAISVGLYIFSIAMIVLFAAFFDAPIIGTCVFLTIIAIATILIVYSAIVYKDNKKTKKETEEDDKVVKEVCKIFDLVGVIIYFVVSFLTMAWSVTWIIFIIVGLCEEIFKLLYNLKKDRK
ncbi:MAG: helix-turn-helix transcriptional regulator [Bacilli bacterium]|nr:helix-turn-helix transcriptional regulator [Bacilli bacterium]